MKNRKSISEKFVCCVWEGKHLRKEDLSTQDGHRVKVLFPGRWNLESGPDFLKAYLEVNGLPITGDVEIHLRTSDWVRHLHQNDPRYNQVVLHVVMTDDMAGQKVRTESGTWVSTLNLRDSLAEELNKLREIIDEDASPYKRLICSDRPCISERGVLSELLDQIGQQRLNHKADRLQIRAKVCGLDQAFYEWIMESLGYSKNRIGFTELAQRIPLQTLREANRKGKVHERLLLAQALLFGIAGFLSSQEIGDWEDGENLPDSETLGYTEKLKELWGRAPSELTGKIMDNTEWCFSGVRPLNFPTRRIAAASHLWSKVPEEGLVNFCRDILSSSDISRSSVRRKEALRRIRAMLTPEIDEYWSYRCTLGGIAQDKPISLLGESRISDIMVNVVFPAMLVRARTDGNEGLKESVIRIYSSYPKLESNRIIKLMTKRIFDGDLEDSSVINSACRQQALIHIYQNFCDHEDGWERCPICGKDQAGESDESSDK